MKPIHYILNVVIIFFFSISGVFTVCYLFNLLPSEASRFGFTLSFVTALIFMWDKSWRKKHYGE